MVQRWKPSWVQGRMIPAGVHPIDGYVSAADHARIVAEAGAAVFAFHPEWTVTGMCDSDCLACRRLTELITEREKGYEEGKADAEQAHAAAWDRATFDSTAYEQGKRDAAEEARAAERRHWEARFRNAEQAHATALAEEVQTHLDSLDILRAEHAAALAEAEHAAAFYREVSQLRAADARAAAPRTLTSDCLHLTEMYVGQSSRDNEYGRRSSVIECLACGALRLDDETVPPNRLAGGDFDTSGQPRTLTADDPEPAVGSVVLGRYEISGQRVMDDDEETTIWRFSDGGWCYEWATVQRMYGPVTLIHDGEATP